MNYFTVGQTFSHAVFVPRAFQCYFKEKSLGSRLVCSYGTSKQLLACSLSYPTLPPPPPHPVILVETLLTLAKSNSYVISS